MFWKRKPKLPTTQQTLSAELATSAARVADAARTVAKQLRATRDISTKKVAVLDHAIAAYERIERVAREAPKDPNSAPAKLSSVLFEMLAVEKEVAQFLNPNR